MNKDKSIIITSNEPWGDLWFSKQHYANELSKLGYKVFFINPVNRWRLSNLLSFSIQEQTLSENLTLLEYKNNFPIWKAKKPLVLLSDFLLSLKLFFFLKKKSYSEVIWWKFDVFRLINIFFFPKKREIFHAVDPYKHFWQDYAQAKRADLIVCSSKKFVPTYIDYGYNPLLVLHGIPEEEIDVREADLSKELKEQHGYFAIITGSIASYWDYEMLNFLLDNKIKILVAGPDTEVPDWIMLKQKKNLVYLGLLHAKKLKYYIAAAAFCIIPYTKASYSFVGTPLKLLNYLAQMKPSITLFPTELPDYLGNAISFANDKQEFLGYAQSILNKELIVNEANILKYLESVSYPKLIEEIVQNLEKNTNN